MAETATALIDTVLRRVRDPNGTAHSRAFTLARLSDMQRITNGALRVVVDTATLTTTAYLPFYQISTSVASGNAVRILGVIEGNRNLDFILWRTLKHIDTEWLRAVASRFEAFSLIGKEQLILWPAQKEAVSVTVVYAALTTSLSTEGTATDMPDDELPLVVDMTTALLLAKTRYIGSTSSLGIKSSGGFDVVMERIGERVKSIARRDVAA